MKQLKFLSLIILSVALLIACSGSSSKGTPNNSDDNNSSTNASFGEAHFSCVIDGQPVSGGAIDQMQFYNNATINDVDEGKELLFYLNDAKSAETTANFAHALRFSIPAKTGTVSFGLDENGWGIEVDIQPNKDHEARYFSDSFTVNVTKISSTIASGTFSGKFKLNGNITDTDKKEIEVTDGKFDVPMRK